MRLSLKNNSPIGELSGFAGIYAEVLHKTGGYPVVVCDRDHVVAVSGLPKKELLERRVSSSLEELMEARQSFTLTAPNGNKLQPVEGSDSIGADCFPYFICWGRLRRRDVFKGRFHYVCNGSGHQVDFCLAVAFLGRQMEEELPG